MPTISVIIPIHNIEAHLRQCLDSVLAQTWQDMEVICIDDGSTDATPTILAEYAQADARIRVFSQENSGPGVARNRGLDQASGAYVIFLDSDDWFEPNLLERMLHTLQANQADLVICRCVEFDTHTGKEYPSEWTLKTKYLHGDCFAPTEVANYLFQFTYGMPWDKLYSRKLLRESGIRFPALGNSEDLAFVFPSILAAKRICICREVLVHHRINRSGSVSNSRVRQPEAPFIAFQIVRQYLYDHGLYSLYEQSFMNWAMEFFTWHISSMDDKEIQRKYQHKLQTDWAPVLNFQKFPVSFYRDKVTYIKYLLALHLPYPAFRLVLKAYKALKRALVG